MNQSCKDVKKTVEGKGEEVEELER